MLDEKQFKKLTTLEIPEYIYQIKASEKQLNKYYSAKPGRQRVTKITKWAEKLIVGQDLNGFYLDKDGNRIVSNFKKAGTPKYIPVNGQVMYSQKGGEFTRALMVRELHQYWKDILEEANFQPFNKKYYPIVIQMNWFAPYSHQTPDNFNFAFAMFKTFEDTLTNNNYIVDDEVRYVSGGFPIYTPVDTFEDRKIIFTFYQDLRNEIQQLKLI
jgi:hypothetical protein